MSSYVYRIYGLESRLLYVGCTDNPIERMRQHRNGSFWWETVTELTITRYDRRDDALLAETVAIRLEFPRYNIKDRAPDHPENDRWFPDRIAIALDHPEDCPSWVAHRMEAARRRARADAERAFTRAAA